MSEPSLTANGVLNLVAHHRTSADPTIREDAEFLEPHIKKAVEALHKRRERVARKTTRRKA